MGEFRESAFLIPHLSSHTHAAIHYHTLRWQSTANGRIYRKCENGGSEGGKQGTSML